MLANKTQPKPICYSTPICFISDGQTIELLNWLVRLIVRCAFLHPHLLRHTLSPVHYWPLTSPAPHRPVQIVAKSSQHAQLGQRWRRQLLQPATVNQMHDYDGKDYEDYEDDDDAMKWKSADPAAHTQTHTLPLPLPLPLTPTHTYRYIASIGATPTQVKLCNMLVQILHPCPAPATLTFPIFPFCQPSIHFTLP